MLKATTLLWRKRFCNTEKKKKKKKTEVETSFRRPSFLFRGTSTGPGSLAISELEGLINIHSRAFLYV